jgi:Tfp pilus assembly protein PilO
MEFRSWLLRNIAFYVAGVLVVSGLLFFLSRDISDRVMFIERQRVDLSARSQILDSLLKLKSDSEKARGLLGSLEEALPTKDELIVFSKELEDFARSNQLDFSLRFGAESPATAVDPGTNNFTITSGGTYENLIRFLRNVENSGYFVSFDLFDLTQSSRGYEILIRGKVFSQ